MWRVNSEFSLYVDWLSSGAACLCTVWVMGEHLGWGGTGLVIEALRMHRDSTLLWDDTSELKAATTRLWGHMSELTAGLTTVWGHTSGATVAFTPLWDDTSDLTVGSTTVWGHASRLEGAVMVLWRGWAAVAYV